MYLLTCFYLLIYAHLNSVFERLSKSVVESKQKINILKLSAEEDEEKKEFDEAKKGEERGTGLAMSFFIYFLLVVSMSNSWCIKNIFNKWDHNLMEIKVPIKFKNVERNR